MVIEKEGKELKSAGDGRGGKKGGKFSCTPHSPSNCDLMGDVVEAS